MAPSTLLTFRVTWGLLQDDDGYLSMPDFIEQLVGEGYRGVECSVATASRHEKFADLIRQHDLQWIPIVFTCGPIDGCDPFVGEDIRAGPGSSWHIQFQAWKCQMQRVLQIGLQDRIALINCFTGHDSMHFSDGLKLFESMHEWYKQSWLPCLAAGHQQLELLHETHRGRLLYSPWVTRQYLEAVPYLYLVADLSHWVCVTEFDADRADHGANHPDSIQRNLLHELVESVISRIRHVQGRVGYSQGPQVPDPRDPVWARHLRLFESWWDAILLHQITNTDRQIVTFTPEHGPWPYQHRIRDLSNHELLLHTNQVNLFLAQRQKQRFRDAVEHHHP